MPALFDVADPRDRANNMLGQSSNSYGNMMREQNVPGKTAGGAISNAMGGGMTGYMMAGMAKGGMTGPQGAALGAGAGLIAYLLS